jgi:uncharacterized protein
MHASLPFEAGIITKHCAHKKAQFYIDIIWAYAHNIFLRLLMARPVNCRNIGCLPEINYFKPRGIPLSDLEEIVLGVDEFEAIRLADLEKLYQEEAAKKMRISRQTFGRILDSAHRKVAEAVVEGKALRIEGGKISVVDATAVRRFRCDDCHHSWKLPYGIGRPADCPSCKGENIHRAGHLGGGSGEQRGRCHGKTQGRHI